MGSLVQPAKVTVIVTVNAKLAWSVSTMSVLTMVSDQSLMFVKFQVHQLPQCPLHLAAMITATVHSAVPVRETAIAIASVRLAWYVSTM